MSWDPDEEGAGRERGERILGNLWGAERQRQTDGHLTQRAATKGRWQESKAENQLQKRGGTEHENGRHSTGLQPSQRARVSGR